MRYTVILLALLQLYIVQALNNNGQELFSKLLVITIPYTSTVQNTTQYTTLQSQCTTFTQWSATPYITSTTVQELLLNTSVATQLYDTNQTYTYIYNNNTVLQPLDQYLLYNVSNSTVLNDSSIATYFKNVSSSSFSDFTYYISSNNTIEYVYTLINQYNLFNSTVLTTFINFAASNTSNTTYLPNLVCGDKITQNRTYTLPLQPLSLIKSIQDNFNVSNTVDTLNTTDLIDDFLAVASPAITLVNSTTTYAGGLSELLASGNRTYTPPITRMLLLVFEDKAFTSTMQTPTWAALAANGTLFTDYHGITHPSQPNYIAWAGGSTFGILDSVNNYDIPETCLVDLFDAAGITWKVYADGYVPLDDGDCNTSALIGIPDTSTNATYNSTTYYRKHNPFMSFTSVSTNITRCRNIVNSAEFANDLETGNLAQFMYYVPDQANDARDPDGESGPDAGLVFAGNWITNQTKQWFAHPNFNDTTLILTFDEDDSVTPANHIYTAILNVGSVPGKQVNTTLNHYSLLKTIELNWNLGNFGRNDVNATDFLSDIL